MALYKQGHPHRERAVDGAYSDLLDLASEFPNSLFTFLGDEVIHGSQPVRELKDWDWSRKLATAGIQRVEFAANITRDEFQDFLDGALARLTVASIDTSEARHLQQTGIKFGAVGIRGEADVKPIDTATISFDLGIEAETVRWLHEEVGERGSLPLVEAEAVVRSLAVAMHGGSHIILPLLQLKEFDQYTTTHSLNVSVLTMGLAEYMDVGPADVRAFGIAGLLHDLGKTRIPRDLLIKPGQLTDAERDVMQRHPADGARIILESHENLDLAAIVAYEHHMMLNGEGYPHPHFRRATHKASELVHVCDVFDALRTERPYRDAWPLEDVLLYLENNAGTMFSADIVHPFVTMIRKNEAAVAVVTSESEAIVLADM